ncbi:hypothetical protein MMSR116_05960 [Methylobacterium mesophilicum SR1.6/6]|uniref:Uncharacterized protein n=1 Tax=Methylobacterium mesophilicum SR1.6/6 TaxID=908290 RepID=A0A6B9FKQ6_9HYPH|nr:hypothetical protein [Methylobacterium mesophilicum]QGY01498.1 hypothetical protein MMSR116_05960 [Methylobacterium mesophilicum SR1.6/6]
MTAEGDAWFAYRCALLAQICAALESNGAALFDDLIPETAAVLSLRAAASSPYPIASAGARQGLPTAIITGAAS